MIRDALSILLVAALVLARPRPGEYSAKESYAKGGGSLEGGYKFTDDVILPSGSGDDGTNVGYGKSAEDLDIPHINLEEHQTSMENEKATIGSGFHDIGPKDVGQEIFAKMEEAAQHAMTIVEGAQKFTDEAAKEQSIKGDANGAYQEQLSLSPDHVHVEGSSDPSMSAAHAPAASAPASAPAAAPAAAPAEEHKEEAAGAAGQHPPPPAGGQPAPPSADAGKPY